MQINTPDVAGLCVSCKRELVCPTRNRRPTGIYTKLQRLGLSARDIHAPKIGLAARPGESRGGAKQPCYAPGISSDFGNYIKVDDAPTGCACKGQSVAAWSKCRKPRNDA